jgi:ribonucleoside-diphosphate reductase alpha chain
VLTEQQIVKKYKVGGIMASGLIVDGLSLFDNIWNACYIANDHGKDLSQDDHNTTAKKDWIRRYHKFAENYFDGDIKQTEYCLKDVFLLHKWTKITQQIQDVDWSQLGRSAEIDIDTMGAAACAGGACEI